MMTLPLMQTIWYVVLIFLIGGSVVLSGSDFGVGVWYLLARPGDERKRLLATVAPFWDGNQVWLIGVGGAAFAAFPPVYGTVLSGLYPLLIAVLLALILRTVSIEYAQKAQAPPAQRAWDLTFGLSSTGAVVGLGLLFGNLLAGLPLNERQELPVGFFAPPPALAVALLFLLLVAFHGAVWTGLKAEGPVRQRARRWGLGAWLAALPLMLGTVVALGLTDPVLGARYQSVPALWVLPGMALLALAVAGAAHVGGRGRVAFGASAAGLLALVASAAGGLFPRLVRASGDDALSLTAHNASSSLLALEAMLVVVVLILPVVLAYTAWGHWLFGQKAEEPEE